MPKTINLIIPDKKMQFLLSVLHTLEPSKENLSKYQKILSLGITSFILITWMFEQVVNETAAKCCELKRCANRVRSRTDNKDEVLEGKIRNLNFSPFTKRTTEYSCELFFHL